MDDVILSGLLQALDFVVLERVGERSFRLIGKLPAWFENLPIRFKLSPESSSLDDQIPFLEHFLVDAEQFWRKETDRWIKSGPWVEIDSTGHEWALEATAVAIGDHKILLLQTGVPQFLEKRDIVQHGRELSLEYRRLRRWESDLVARQEKLEDLIRARTRQLWESNESLTKEILARRNAEAVVRREEEKFRTLVEACPFAVVWKEHGCPKYINPAFASIFGCQLDDLESGRWSADFLSTARPADPVSEHESSPVTAKILTKDGLERIIRWRTVTFGPDNQLMFLEDVTQQKKMEDHLAQAQKMEVVGTLAGGVAHDFNNLLQLIRGYAELLLIRRRGGKDDSRELQEIIDAATRGNALTRQLLTVSRRLETQQKTLDLNETVQTVYRLLVRTFPKMIDLDVSLAPDLGVISGDSAQLEQVLVNLAINARDAMPEGGRLSIETQNELVTAEASGAAMELDPGEYVVLRVRDTGVGMDEVIQSRMFEPFFTTKEPDRGAGLGLAMVYGIVKSHKAHIFCSSQIGAGTCFTVCFPRSHAEIPASTPDRSVIPGGNERILLVEDEECVRRQGEEIMAGFGYTVIGESNPELALQRFAREHESIDLVVLDLIMPGMSGYQCLSEILKIDPKAKVIITSGRADAKDREDLAAAKAFVAKPYTVGVFLQTIRAVLDQV